MTSTLKTTAATALSLSALTDGETADASDVSVPFVEAEDEIDEARETVSVSATDTHVKNLDDALTAGTGITKSIKNAAGDENIEVAIDDTVVATTDNTLSMSNKTLVTPTITSMVNANHDHEDAAGGGKIKVAAIDSETATSSYVLTANGSGGASWAAAGGGGASPVDVTGTAGEALSERDVVFLKTSDGKWYKTDIDSDPPLLGWPRGIVKESGGIASGSTGDIRILGEVSGFSGLTASALVYASSTAGGYTQTKPTLTKGGSQSAIVVIGFAVSSTSVMVVPNYPARFLKRADVSADGTMTIKHYTDSTEQTRAVRAYLSSTGCGDVLTSYDETNHDYAYGMLQGGTPSSASESYTGTGTWHGIGNYQGGDLIVGQKFRGRGDLSSFSFDLNGVSGSPGNIVWKIRTDEDGYPGEVVASGTIASASVVTSGTNTVNLGWKPYFPAYYSVMWLTLETESKTLAANTYYQWSGNSTGAYDYGRGVFSADGGESWNDLNDTTDFVFSATFSAITYENTYLAQSFQLSSDDTVGQVCLYLRKAGAPTSTLTVQIRNDSSGDPTGAILATSTSVSESSIDSDWEWVRFTFSSPASLTAGTTYWIRLHTARSANGTHYTKWAMDYSGSYSSGEAKWYYNSTWQSLSPAQDFIFQVHGQNTSLDEIATVGSWTLGDGTVACRFDDGDAGNSDTQTTFRNDHSATLDLTCEVCLP